MGYRVFTDSQGTEWQTWDVVPRLAERRVSDRRRMPPIPRAIERRHSTERRVQVSRRPVLTAGLDGGWLCFETSAQKRRLAPIPNDWMRCAEDQLEKYCKLAKPALRGSAALDISRLL